MLPEKIGPYLIEKKIGAGGMGTVYLGYHEITEKPAAVKALSASLAREEGFLLRFEREVDALKKLQNPHIVEFYDSGSDGDTVYFAMEYVDGTTLTQEIRQHKRLHWLDVVNYSIQVCSALKAAHNQGIIHRDLKPSNLLIDKTGIVKLTDFGVAQLFASTRLTVTGGVIGTAEFMSPEQAQGKRATKESDLYSLGAVMYAMLTGRTPFSGKTSLDVMHQHMYGQFDRPSRYVPEIPVWVDDLICQLLEKDPKNRVPDALVLARKLEEIKKKVELSRSSGETMHGASTGTSSETGEFVLHGVMVGPGGGSGPGGATLMHNLMRAEMEQEHRGTAVSRFFNNTWVLLGLLVLLVVGGYFALNSSGPTEQELLDQGRKLMLEPEGERWLTAKRDYFEPLIELNPAKWQEELQPEMRKIRLYEIKRDLGLSQQKKKKNILPPSEPERFLLMAYEYIELGDFEKARETLSALESMLEGSDEHQEIYALTQQILLDLTADRKHNFEREQFIAQANRRAEEFLKQNDPESARKIWQSIVDLYRDDPWGQPVVEEARQKLSQNQTATND